MRSHSASEFRYYGNVIGPDGTSIRITGVGLGLEDLQGRRLEQAQLTKPETSHVLTFRFGDVTGQLDESCYVQVEGVLYIVDYLRDPRNPRPNMWTEAYCHVERGNT